MCPYVHACVCVHMCMYMRAYVHVCVCTRACACLCMLIYMYACVPAAGMLCPILDINKNGRRYRRSEINRSFFHVHD